MRLALVMVTVAALTSFAHASHLVGPFHDVPTQAGVLGEPRMMAGMECEPQWTNTFDEQTSIIGSVRTMLVVDEGSGPALYVGGPFVMAGDLEVNRIARWDGWSWTTLDGGVDSDGPAPYVQALVVFDDGDGPALYAGGRFTSAGGMPANNIAKWDGESWSPLGSGTNNIVAALAVYDDGNGPALYAGGWFTTAGDVPVNRIAKWDGREWSPVGAGVDSNNVRALHVFDDGIGEMLYVGGQFVSAGGGVPGTKTVARWDGQSWLPVGGGSPGATSYFIQDFAVFDDGSGSALYMAGWFALAEAPGVIHIAKWDGETWSGLGGVSGAGVTANALTVFDDGAGGGPALYLGGSFLNAGGVPVNKIAKWDGTSWSSLDGGVGSALNTSVNALAGFDDGSGKGPTLYVGGFQLEPPTGDAFLATWQGCPAALPKIAVHFDIKPASCPNPLNIGSKGVLPTAIAGAHDFDVGAIDVSTLSLSRADGIGGAVGPLNGPPGPGIVVGSATSPTDHEACDCSGSGSLDEHPDLLLKFSVPQLVEALALNGLSAGDEVELVITGLTHDGEAFQGSDCILIVGAKRSPGGPAGSDGENSEDLATNVLTLLSAWGSRVTPGTHSDLNGDGVIDVNDLLIILGNRD